MSNHLFICFNVILLTFGQALANDCRAGESCVRLLDCDKPPDVPKICRTSRSRGVCCQRDCGIDAVGASAAVSPLVIGGRNAIPGTWPWMTSLLRVRGDPLALGHNCGGTVINEQFILTAAHCFPPGSLPSDFKVRISGYDLSKDVNEDRRNNRNAVESEITEIRIHPNYTFGAANNDIAILKLRRVLRDETTKPICLPGELVNRNVQEKSNAMLIGWGFNDSDISMSTDKLQELRVPVHSVRDCEVFYRDRVSDQEMQMVFPLGISTNKFMCSGDVVGKKDACAGDSGGPLMHKTSDNQWIIVGLVSFGSSICGRNLPTFYTRVEAYLDWINQNSKISK